MSLYEYDSASVTITIDGKDITAGDMVAVNERGEVVNVQDRIDDEPMTPYQTSATRRWYAETEAFDLDLNMAKFATLAQPFTASEAIAFPVLNSITGTVRNDETTSAQVSETAPAAEAARPDHELRILRALDLARLHRVTAEDLRERASVRALSDSTLPLDAPHGGLCRGRYRATRSQVCDDTRVRCRGALGLYAPVLRPNIGMRWSLCRSEGVYLADWCVRMRWRCTTLRLTGMVSL